MLSKTEAENPLLEVGGLRKYFPTEINLFGPNRVKGNSGTRHFVRAVDGVSFSIFRGQTLGFVGESGCGKSTLARLILRLIDPDEGKVCFEGQDLTGLKRNQLRPIRRKMQIIFQNPYASLNPRLSINSMLAEIMRVHGVPGDEIGAKVRTLIELVGLDRKDLGKYPHEFSGGQRQRIGIARALAVNPVFIVADEPVSSLDVSIQAQIINLLVELQKNLDLTYLFIAHDLGVVKYISDKIAVMYMGQIVEMADSSDLYDRAAHPYTRMLLSSLPGFMKVGGGVDAPSRGDVFTSGGLEGGCKFRSRCAQVLAKCAGSEPRLKEVGRGHFVSCFLY